MLEKKPQQIDADSIKDLMYTQLLEVFEAWLQAEWPDHPGQHNAERGASALGNYRRSLRAISYAHGHEGNLEITPATILLNNGEQIGIYVENGLSLEAHAKGKAMPKTQLVQNMQSNARAISKFVIANCKNTFKSGAKKDREKTTQKRREPMQYFEWPLSLRGEFEEFQRWLGATLPQAEAEYRPDTLAPISIRAQRFRITPYIKWRLKNNLEANSLTDLINESEFARHLDEYINEDNNGTRYLGGYTSAKHSSVCVASLIRYLVATEQLDPSTNKPTPEFYKSGIRRNLSERRTRFEECASLKRAFYRLGRDKYKEGGKQNKRIHYPRVKNWTPKDMRNLRDQGFYTPLQRTGNKTPSKMDRFARKRNATIFGISAETPLRILTLSLLTWDDMNRLPNGRWEILVTGEKLKVAMIGDEINKYHMVYSPKASTYVDEYRKVLSENFGEAFETEVPFVFPVMDVVSKKGRRGNPRSLATGISRLALEMRDTWFNPHSARHTVATYLINELGAPGIAVAAKLLGDKPETVLKYYLNELSSEAKEIAQYFDLLDR